MARAWNSPSRPVMPCTRRRVSRSTRMLTGDPRWSHAARFGGPRCRYGFLGRLVERGRRLEVGSLEDGGSLVGVRPDDPDHHRNIAHLLGAGLDEAIGHLIA